ncbi:MAG: 23S rRNA (adenine(2503)-C(2))-methyltransferase RlmN [Deferribacteraceae bacterium]|jgi:23S rRNA (adenine2503-C2)-methyltransferase|nr:23S rRNA (adenine(2503)-C(2))-methyltransferase RlmN [Deferribacteraceae bacterium]
MQKKLSLNSCSLEELTDIVLSLGEKPYRAGQLYKWLYFRKCAAVEEMSDLPKAFRTSLAEMAEVSIVAEVDRKVSKKDRSIKFLFELADGNRIESVILYDNERTTACISTQVGCTMGCKFCSTAQIGFKRNLTTAEILDQIRILERVSMEEGMTPEGRLTNIVFMGMGEPLDNFDNVYKSLSILMNEDGYGYSHKRITISTSGLTDKIAGLFKLETPPHLAVSLNAPTQEKRLEVMPISNAYPLNKLLALLRTLPMHKRKKITFEYVLLKGINDTTDDAKALVKLIKDLPAKVNLIRYNGGGNAEFKTPDEKNVLAFQKILVDNEISAFIRKSLGSDILGACGQLAAGYNLK